MSTLVPTRAATGNLDRAPVSTGRGTQRHVARRRHRHVWPVVAPAAVYLAGQTIVVGMLAWLCSVRGYSLLDRLTAWDGDHFLRIAADGYTYSTQAGTDASPAHLPGYPALIAALHAATGVPLAAVAIGTAAGCGVVFACAMPHLVGEIPGTNRRVELIAVALVAVSPMSIVFAMAYSEALFCALACWALVFALRRAWWPAALLGFAAGLVRISGLALAAAFAVVAITTLIQQRHHPRAAAAAALRPGLAALAAAAGTVGWMAYSGLRMGSPTAWFTAQQNGWDSHFDFGIATTRFIYRMATTAPDLLEVATAAVIIASCVLLAYAARQPQQQPLLLLAYGAAAVAEVIGSAGLMNSKIRLLIPAFTILIPIAVGLARLSKPNLATALSAITIAGTWFSAYSLTIWQYAI